MTADVGRETGLLLTVEAAASDAVALPAAWLVANTPRLVVGLFAACATVRARCVHLIVVDRTVVDRRCGSARLAVTCRLVVSLSVSRPAAGAIVVAASLNRSVSPHL